MRALHEFPVDPHVAAPLPHGSLRHCTLALAFCYFERLVLYGVGVTRVCESQHVNKENRKVVCADCCLIAYKFNQLAEAEGHESACDDGE